MALCCYIFANIADSRVIMIRAAFGSALVAGAVPGRAAAAPDAATSAAPAPVVDQPSDSPPAELAVTARRRPEDPQKIPLSLTLVGGASYTINITTRLPRFGFEANAELLAGSNGYVQAKGSVTGPITGTLAARFFGLLTRRDGVIRSVRIGVRTGRNQNSISNEAVRGQLLFKPREDVQVRLIADWSNFAGE